MISNRIPRRITRLGLSALVGLVASGFLDHGSVEAATCRHVRGRFTLHAVSGPSCTSPVGVCIAGAYVGVVNGNALLTGSSVVPTADTPLTGIVLLTGDTVTQTATGNLIIKSAVLVRAAGIGDFAQVDTIIGGTGEWAGATGRLSARGTFIVGTGGAATYVGEVCVP